MAGLKQKVAKGAVWTLCEKLSVQVVGFVVGTIKVRNGSAIEKPFFDRFLNVEPEGERRVAQHREM